MTADMRSVVSEETPQSVAPAAERPNGIDGAARPLPYGPSRRPVDGSRRPGGDGPNGTPPDAPAEPSTGSVPAGERDAAPDRVDGASDDVSDEGDPVSGELVDSEPVDGVPVSGELVDSEPVDGVPVAELVDSEPVDGVPVAELVDSDPVEDASAAGPVAAEPAADEIVAEEIVAAEVAAQLGTVVGDDPDADPAEFAAAAVLDVLRASGWADAAEASELRAEVARTKELLNMVVRDHRAREASAAGSVNQQLHWLVPLLRAAHGVAFGSLGAKVALRTAVQDVPPDVLLQAGLRIDYGVEPAFTDEERQAPPLN